MNPTERVTQHVPDHEPMKPPEDSRKDERSQVDPLMPIEPYIGPRIGQACKESDLSFDFERQGQGWCINHKEEKIDEY